jgi:hypothetical protein
MPFDSAEFFREQTFPAATEAAWYTRLAAVLGRVPWPSLFRSSPEPVDLAVLRVLEEARGLIEQREEWVQGEYETFHGERCAVGALRVAASFLNYPSAGRVALDLLTAVAVRRGYRNVETMNDHSRHQHVLTAFDTAIEAARHQIAPTT